MVMTFSKPPPDGHPEWVILLMGNDKKIFEFKFIEEKEMTRTIPNSEPLTGYAFFLRGQSIFQAGSASRPVYGIVEGDIAIMRDSRVVDTLGPGGLLAEAMLPPASGLLAVAHTNCRLVALDAVVFAILAPYPPAFVRQIIGAMAGLTLEPSRPKIKWPASLQARRARRQLRRPREQAGVFKIVQLNEEGGEPLPNTL
jgi:hypothetical protein